jgi:hypothetical protein
MSSGVFILEVDGTALCLRLERLHRLGSIRVQSWVNGAIASFLGLILSFHIALEISDPRGGPIDSLSHINSDYSRTLHEVACVTPEASFTSIGKFDAILLSTEVIGGIGASDDPTDLT